MKNEERSKEGKKTGQEWTGKADNKSMNCGSENRWLTTISGGTRVKESARERARERESESERARARERMGK